MRVIMHSSADNYASILLPGGPDESRRNRPDGAVQTSRQRLLNDVVMQ